MGYKNSVAEFIRSDISKQLSHANYFYVATLVTVNSETRFATICSESPSNLIHNVVVLDDVNISDMRAGDDVLVLQLRGGLSIIFGTLSTNKNRPIDLTNFDGGLKVGKKSAFLPKNVMYTQSSVESGAEFKEEIIYDETMSAYSYNQSYSYMYEMSESVLAEDVYAGEIRRLGTGIYGWCGSYESNNSSYSLPAEWVRWDDARYLQGIPISDETPTDGTSLVYSAEVGEYRPVLSSSDFNEAAVQDHDSVTAGTLTSTASTSLTDLNSISVTVTADSDALVLLFGFATAINSTANQFVGFVPTDSSNNVLGVITSSQESSPGHYSSIPIFGRKEVGAGNHTFKVRWYVSGGTGYCYARYLIAVVLAR